MRGVRLRNKFQTLIGTVKGGKGGKGKFEIPEVSNPYRYGQRAQPTPQPRPQEGFQTLIGTVKGPSGALWTTWSYARFQTLIGTVKG